MSEQFVSEKEWQHSYQTNAEEINKQNWRFLSKWNDAEEKNMKYPGFILSAKKYKLK